jgi:enoyl-[acyl-carrier-protein] reductase (NADH)
MLAGYAYLSPAFKSLSKNNHYGPASHLHASWISRIKKKWRGIFRAIVHIQTAYADVIKLEQSPYDTTQDRYRSAVTESFYGFFRLLECRGCIAIQLVIVD